MENIKKYVRSIEHEELRRNCLIAGTIAFISWRGPILWTQKRRSGRGWRVTNTIIFSCKHVVMETVLWFRMPAIKWFRTVDWNEESSRPQVSRTTDLLYKRFSNADLYELLIVICLARPMSFHDYVPFVGIWNFLDLRGFSEDVLWMGMVKQNGKDILPSFNVEDGALDSWLCSHAAYNTDGKYWLLPQHCWVVL